MSYLDTSIVQIPAGIQDLSFAELEDVNGGIVPLLGAALITAGGAIITAGIAVYGELSTDDCTTTTTTTVDGNTTTVTESTVCT